MNSAGAAPVPPSLPSTTMKSGVMPVSRIALAIANHSQGWPIASLKPVGLPPDSDLSRSMKRSSSMGVVNAEWAAGDTQSFHAGTPRAWAISGVTLGPGSTPPCSRRWTEIEPSPVSWANRPSRAPRFSARIALADSAPKLMAGMLNTEASYGRVQAGPPIDTLKS